MKILIISIILILLLTGLALPSYGQGNPLGPLTIWRDMERTRQRERMHNHIWDENGYLIDRDLYFEDRCLDCYRRGFWKGYDLRQWEEEE